MELTISNSIQLNNRHARRDGTDIAAGAYNPLGEPQELYRALGLSYMKFFKMDLLCKWAWLGAEALLMQDGNPVYEGVDKNKVAVVLMTKHGCLDVDKKYLESMKDIPSPALFVYTLPNIMLGEICIRHGFKGEQLCLVSDGFDTEEMAFWVNDLLQKRGMEACLCGWVDAWDGNRDVALHWITKNNNNGAAFTKEQLDNLYKL